MLITRRTANLLSVTAAAIITISYVTTVKAQDMVQLNVTEMCDMCCSEYTTLMDELDSCDDLYEWYSRYKTLVATYSSLYDLPESIYTVFTEEDINYLGRCVETECSGQSFASKVRVANVILNRVNNENFPSTPTNVVTQHKQFSYKKSLNSVTAETWLAIEFAYEIKDLTDGALYFHSIKERTYFYGKKYLFTDEAGHKFYS